MSEQEVFEALKYRIVVDAYGNRFYCNNTGEWHRENGPAVEYANGTKRWYYKGRLHRTNGPAVIWADGTELWYQYGLLHRIDGHAVVTPGGYNSWYINGERLTEDEFNQRVKDYE